MLAATVPALTGVIVDNREWTARISVMSKTLLVTGSNGLIGSEVCLYFGSRGFAVHGLDNNQRAVFFGPAGDTRWNQKRLEQGLRNFHHHELDVRDREGVLALVTALR